MTQSRLVPPGEYGAQFDLLWSRLRTRFFKLEQAQSYDESEDPSLIAFKAGASPATVASLFEERLQDETSLLAIVAQKGIAYVRLRAVALPLTDYLRWEFQTYHVSARYGQTILVHEITDDTRKALTDSSDFMLFDSFAVIVLRYDSIGARTSIVLHESPDVIARFAMLANTLQTHSELLGAFERRHGLALAST